jgi:hypothetical protein
MPNQALPISIGRSHEGCGAIGIPMPVDCPVRWNSEKLHWLQNASESKDGVQISVVLRRYAELLRFCGACASNGRFLSPKNCE